MAKKAPYDELGLYVVAVAFLVTGLFNWDFAKSTLFWFWDTGPIFFSFYLLGGLLALVHPFLKRKKNAIEQVGMVFFVVLLNLWVAGYFWLANLVNLEEFLGGATELAIKSPLSVPAILSYANVFYACYMLAKLKHADVTKQVSQRNANLELTLSLTGLAILVVSVTKFIFNLWVIESFIWAVFLGNAYLKTVGRRY